MKQTQYPCNRLRRMVKALTSSFLLSLFPFIPSEAQMVPMDYSSCGYHRSEIPIPSLPVAVSVQPSGGDDAATLQQAIDWVSRQKPDKRTGLRGAVLLTEGTFTIGTPLRIRVSGVVLRGSGRDKTVLRKEGFDRGAAIYIEGVDKTVVKDTLDVADAASGDAVLRISGGKISQGDRLIVWRPSTLEWEESLKCTSFGGGKRMGYWAWHPGDIDLRWHRQVMQVIGAEVTIDAPVTCSIDKQWGGAKAIVYENQGVIAECGVENLSLESAYDEKLPKDENHCWDGVYVAHAENCWVRMVNFRNFAGSAVVIQKTAQQVTVEDCKSMHPVSEIGGFRRRTFLTMGEKTLFQRCYSEHGINDYAVGHTAPGPNAFVQCDSYESFGPSGAISSWAPGILFDLVNIDGNDIVFKNWELEKYAAGWGTANSTMWQSTAAGLFCYSPDSLNRNYSHGCWGQISGNGEYSAMNEHVKPYSLFQAQLEKRLKVAQGTMNRQCRVLTRNLEASSSPTIEEAMKMAQEALEPRMTLQMWIDSAVFAGDVSVKNIKRMQDFKSGKATSVPVSSDDFCVKNGWLCLDGAVLAGGKHQTPWWNGRMPDAAIAKAKYALTRFIPGQEGQGTTDRIDSVVVEMDRSHTLVFSQNYGLWTDRRRDDHERIRRKNGDVWAPFYEQPFARTGKELAWDGLSKYDLTQLNKWYFWRLKEFAKKAKPMGLLLKNQHYFQHNILEAGAHWVDCPWRTANNVNQTPFLEPVNFTGDKRIFTATLFYDIENQTLRELHRQYIRQSLDAFKGQPNVIHSIGEEFTGPLHFVEFWLDVIAEWEQENGPVLVDLAVTKDVQDAILNDPVRSKVVDIIDIEQWFYHNQGLYAPPGGVNMAQRQYMRKIRTGSVGFDETYRAVSEYRVQYPDKAVVFSARNYPEMCWASLMAGGSCAAIPVKDKDFLHAIAAMQPSQKDGAYLLQGADGMVVCQLHNHTSRFSLPKGSYQLFHIDEKTGAMKLTQTVKETVAIEGNGIFWLKKVK